MSEHCCHLPALGPQSYPKPRFGWAILGLVLAAVSMLLAMPGMLGMERASWMPIASFGASLIVTLGLGWRFWIAIPRLLWKANMNTLVGLGIGAAYGLSFWQWSRGNIDSLYFDSAAFVAAFVYLGQQTERWMERQVGGQIPHWMNFLPKKAMKKSGDQEAEVEISAIRSGDRLIIRPGERIPVDARLLSDLAEVDESLITGESKPLERPKGYLFKQGTLNLSQPIEVEVVSGSENSYYQVLANKVSETLSQKSDFQKRADKWAAILTPLVVILAAGTAVYWGYFQQAYDLMIANAVSVLVIACPCVIGMATPISLFVGVIRCAKRGILLSHLNVIERVQEINVLAFDKTGTLTEGRPEVSGVFAIENISQKEILQAAASLEQRSEHPYARAIVERAKAENIQLLEPEDLRVGAGKGLIGKIIRDGKSHTVCIGNIIWLFENGVESTGIPESLRWEAEGSSASVIWLAVDQKVQGILILKDRVRAGAQEMIDALKDDGYEVGIITGDAENVARSLAKELKLQFYHYGVVPEEKATIVRRLSEKKKKGLDVLFPKVAFVGDGINDAPALAAAHLGMALGSGTALAQQSADVILSENRLSSIQDFFKMLKETRFLLNQNLWLAFIYNLIAIPVAAGVLYPLWGIVLDPGIAALAMSLSSLSLLFNALRVLRR